MQYEDNVTQSYLKGPGCIILNMGIHNTYHLTLNRAMILNHQVFRLYLRVLDH